jgi:N-sulfoglucosamine sulfohydrolase
MAHGRGDRAQSAAMSSNAVPSRRELLKLASALPLAVTVACASSPEKAKSDAAPRKPRNLLVIVSDDQSARDSGCYGNSQCRTPRIDRLAGEGLRFERAYSAVAVCQPSRSSIYTGLYPHHNGATGFGPIRDDVATWPELLNAAGVATALIGKLDVDPASKFPFEFLVKANEMQSRRAPGAFEAQFRRFLATVGARRFAAVITPHDPHRPFDEEAPATPSLAPEDVRVPKWLWDTPGTRLELAQYYDCIARLDETVARVLAALDEHGALDDTLIVFTSDNGAAFPFAKSTLYEAGVRMPLIVRGPGVARGATSAAFVSLVDLLPTALELFDVAPVHALDGMSLLPLLRGESATTRPSIVTAHTGNLGGDDYPCRAIRGERFKYIRNFKADEPFVNNVVGHTLTWESGEELAARDPQVHRRMQSFLYRPTDELYDLSADPDELANLAGDPRFDATLADCRAQLRAWMASAGDPLLETWNA